MIDGAFHTFDEQHESPLVQRVIQHRVEVMRKLLGDERAAQIVSKPRTRQARRMQRQAGATRGKCEKQDEPSLSALMPFGVGTCEWAYYLQKATDKSRLRLDGVEYGKTSPLASWFSSLRAFEPSRPSEILLHVLLLAAQGKACVLW